MCFLLLRMALGYRGAQPAHRCAELLNAVLSKGKDMSLERGGICMAPQWPSPLPGSKFNLFLK